MNRKIFYVALFTMSAFCLKAQESIPIDSCYQWATSNYPLILRYHLIDQAEGYNLSNAAKAWIPQVTLNAKASYQSEVTTLPLTPDLFGGKLPKGFQFPAVSKDQYQAQIEVSQQLWEGGRTRHSKEISKATAYSERKQLDSDLYAIRERVNRLFFGCLLQEAMIHQNEILQQQLLNNLSRIQGMVDYGVANSSDLQQIEVELLQVQSQKTELQASRQAFRLMLSQFIGKEIASESVLVLPQPEVLLSKQILRPELLAMDAESLLINTQEKQIKSSRMPLLAAFVRGGVGRPGLNFLKDDFSPFYVAGMRLSWNIGSLYTLRSNRHLLQTNRSALNVKKETFLFNTHLQMTQQEIEIEKLSKLRQADQKIVTLRTDLREVAEVKHANGVISTADLVTEINAESAAAQQMSIRDLQRIAAIYQYKHITNN